MRQVGDGLHQPFKPAVVNFIQKQRQDDRDGKPEDQRQEVQPDRIKKCYPKAVIVKYFLENVQADPGTLPHPGDKIVILESDQ